MTRIHRRGEAIVNHHAAAWELVPEHARDPDVWASDVPGSTIRGVRLSDDDLEVIADAAVALGISVARCLRLAISAFPFSDIAALVRR